MVDEFKYLVNGAMNTIMAEKQQMGTSGEHINAVSCILIGIFYWCQAR